MRNLTSLGIIKVPGLSEQAGHAGLPLPDRGGTAIGALSGTPTCSTRSLTLEVYQGDLGLDNGQGVNAYSLNTDSLTQIAGRKSDAPTIELSPGDKVDLPGDLGSIELEVDSAFRVARRAP